MSKSLVKPLNAPPAGERVVRTSSDLADALLVVAESFHDAEITPDTIIPPWFGERLDLDYAIYTCLANEQVRRDRAAGRQARDDLPPRCTHGDEPASCASMQIPIRV